MSWVPQAMDEKQEERISLKNARKYIEAFCNILHHHIPRSRIKWIRSVFFRLRKQAGRKRLSQEH